MSVLLPIALIALGAAAADGVTLEVRLDPPVTPFHRQARFTIVVEKPGALDVDLPDMLNRFGGLPIYGIPGYRSESLDDDRVRITETYTLDPVFIGDYAIEPVEIGFGDGQRLVVPSPALRVRDLTEAEREEAMQFDHALAQPAPPLPPLYRRWSFWGAAAIVASAIGGGAYLLWWRRRMHAERAAPPKMPWERAYERLQALDERQLSRSGQHEAYYVDLSAILRYYIEDRFTLHAPERTTPEFLEELAESGSLDDAHERFLGSFLRHCDRVKFARYEPKLDEMELRFTEVLRFVDDTVPKRDEEERGEAA